MVSESDSATASVGLKCKQFKLYLQKTHTQPQGDPSNSSKLLLNLVSYGSMLCVCLLAKNYAAEHIKNHAILLWGTKCNKTAVFVG